MQLLAAVTDDLAKKGVHAGKLDGAVAKVVGGGRPAARNRRNSARRWRWARKLAGEQLAG